MAAHIFEMAELGLFCDYCLKKNIAKIRLIMVLVNAANNISKVKGDFKVIFNLQCSKLFRVSQL